MAENLIDQSAAPEPEGSSPSSSLSERTLLVPHGFPDKEALYSRVRETDAHESRLVVKYTGTNVKEFNTIHCKVISVMGMQTLMGQSQDAEDGLKVMQRFRDDFMESQYSTKPADNRARLPATD